MRRRSVSGMTRTPTGPQSRTWTTSIARRPFPGTPTSIRPLFAQAIWPLGRLPWPVFGVVWAAAAGGSLRLAAATAPGSLVGPALVATVPEILTGNIYALMASALVLGVTRGTPWVFLGLTKVTPGLVGVAGSLRSRRWRALAVVWSSGRCSSACRTSRRRTPGRTGCTSWPPARTALSARSGLPWLSLTLASRRSGRDGVRGAHASRLAAPGRDDPRQPDVRPEHPDSARRRCRG